MVNHRRSLSVIILLLLNVAIDLSTDSGGALCISFDKWDMLHADKMIIGYGEHTYTTTDPAFIRAFTKETLAGDMTEYCCSDLNEGWVEIYRGERLVRRMRYIANHETFAYEADMTHWVLFGKEGHAALSKATWEKLHEITGR